MVPVMVVREHAGRCMNLQQLLLRQRCSVLTEPVLQRYTQSQSITGSDCEAVSEQPLASDPILQDVLSLGYCGLPLAASNTHIHT